MLTVSPPVSPSVVARILMIQKVRVTAGTLLIAVFAFTATAQLLECEKHRRVPGVAAFRRVLHARRDIAKQVVVVGQIVTNTGTDAGNRAAIVGVGRLMEYLRADLQLRCDLVGERPAGDAEIARAAAAVENTATTAKGGPVSPVL